MGSGSVGGGSTGVSGRSARDVMVERIARYTGAELAPRLPSTDGAGQGSAIQQYAIPTPPPPIADHGGGGGGGGGGRSSGSGGEGDGGDRNGRSDFLMAAAAGTQSTAGPADTGNNWPGEESGRIFITACDEPQPASSAMLALVTLSWAAGTSPLLSPQEAGAASGSNVSSNSAAGRGQPTPSELIGGVGGTVASPKGQDSEAAQPQSAAVAKGGASESERPDSRPAVPSPPASLTTTSAPVPALSGKGPPFSGLHRSIASSTDTAVTGQTPHLAPGKEQSPRAASPKHSRPVERAVSRANRDSSEITVAEDEIGMSASAARHLGRTAMPVGPAADRVAMGSNTRSSASAGVARRNIAIDAESESDEEEGEEEVRMRANDTPHAS